MTMKVNVRGMLEKKNHEQSETCVQNWRAIVHLILGFDRIILVFIQIYLLQDLL